MWPKRFIIFTSLISGLSPFFGCIKIHSEGLNSRQDSIPTTDAKSLGALAACQSESELYKHAFGPDGTKDLKACLDENPNNPLAHFLLGAAYHQKKAFQSAALHLKESLARDPQLGRAWVALGYVYLDQAATAGADHATLIEEAAKTAFLEALAIERTLDIRASAALGLSSLYQRKASRFRKHGQITEGRLAEQAARDRYHEALRYNPSLGSALTQREIADSWPSFVFLPDKFRASQVHDSFRALRERVRRLRELENVHR